MNMYKRNIDIFSGMKKKIYIYIKILILCNITTAFRNSIILNMMNDLI